MGNKLARINLVSRISLAFIFIYHGLVPKLLWLSETEQAIVKAHNLGFDSAIVSTVGGVMEISLGICLAFWRQSMLPVYTAAVLLVLLLIDIALFMPSLLIEAFNPVSVNLAALALCYCIYLSQAKCNKP